MSALIFATPTTIGITIKMPTGTVLWFNDINGTGRICGDDGTSVKVSHSSLLNDGYKVLDEGQRVKYDVVKVSSGLEARSVEVLS